MPNRLAVKGSLPAATRAERSADPRGGIKARQLFGVACKAGSGQACWRLSRLMERGVITRPMGGYGLPTCLRISVGLPEDNAKLVDAIDAELFPK